MNEIRKILENRFSFAASFDEPELDKAVSDIQEHCAKESSVKDKEIERLRVQLAGCGVAALGYCRGKNEVKKGSYSYSASLQDCMDLYEKYNKIIKKIKGENNDRKEK